MEFQGFPKIPRLFREMVITEKLDGTNASVYITKNEPIHSEYTLASVWMNTDTVFNIHAGSRTRWITPTNDNYGFAAWVRDNAVELAKLGPGHHFGEWWGKGIQRNYGLDHRRFSLFNVHRWNAETLPSCCHVVPTLYAGTVDTLTVTECLADLDKYGSQAAPGFMKPEGVIVFHTAANSLFKVTLENDESPKGAKHGSSA